MDHQPLVVRKSDELAERRSAMQTRLGAADLEEVRSLFDHLCRINEQAGGLDVVAGVEWGFTPYDTRFLSSLRDQTQTKALTKQQLKTVRVILLRNNYSAQLALTT